MNAYVDSIKTIVEHEKNSRIYKETVCNAPLWRLIRSSVIDNYLYCKYDFGKRNQRKAKISYFIVLRSFFSSLLSLLKLMLSKKKSKVAIFAFQRLQKIESLYTDKFTDPLTDHLEAEKFLIFQRPLGGKHLKPRLNHEKTVPIEALDYTAKLIGTLLTPFVFLFYGKKILNTFYEARILFSIRYSYILTLTIRTARFLVSYYLYYNLFKRLKTKKVFLVNREINFPIIRAAHKLGIDSFELQHGITFSYTVLYSTQFNEHSDPNYFLSFGEFWKGSQFGIPKEKILNLGWGYKNIIKSRVQNHSSSSDDYILVISEPRISSKIIGNVIELAMKFRELIFDIRLHPQEKLSQDISEQISQISNLRIVDNSTESSSSLASYKYVLGVNSSVLFEAISLNKRVGCFNYGGCHPFAFLKIKDNPFFILHSKNDFPQFLQLSKKTCADNENLFYSNFNAELLNKLIDKTAVTGEHK